MTGTHHDRDPARRYRYRCEVRSGQTQVAIGMDCRTLTFDGLIERLDGSFGDFPPLVR